MRRWAERWPPELLLFLAAAIALVSAAPLNTDTAYGLVAARRLLGGERFYIDFFETNPPLIYWLYAAAAYVGRLLSLSDPRTMGWFVAALLALSTLTAMWAFEPGRGRFERTLLVGSLLTAAVVPYFSWTGQREQVAAILFFPYCIVAARAASGQRLPRGFSIWCGILAGVGLAIKPFFLFAWLAVEAGVAIAAGWRRLMRAESLSIVAVQLLYGVAILAVTPQYVTKMVPVVARLYTGYGDQLEAGVRSTRFAGLAIVGAAAAGTLFWKRATGRVRETAIFGAATLGWLLAFVAQRKGWAYHLIPAFIYGSVSAVIGIKECLETMEAGASRRPRIMATAFSAPLLVVVLWASLSVPQLVKDVGRSLAGPRNVEADVADAVSEFVSPDEPVFFLSTSMWPAFPVVNMVHARWPYRYSFMWPIPALYPGRHRAEPLYRPPAEQGVLERQFFDAVVDDLARTPPKVIVVDSRPRLAAMNGRRFDFLQYFSASDRFRDLMTHYRSVVRVGPWEVYERE